MTANRVQSGGLPDLSRTEAAITAFDKVDAEFEEWFDKVGVEFEEYMSSGAGDLTLAQTQDLIRRMEDAGVAVGQAYGLDTADRNDLPTCTGMVRPGPAVPSPGAEPSFVRRMVAQWREQA